MPCRKYKTIKFSPDSLARIRQVNEIITQYAAQDLDLSSRQLYYRFVAQDLFPASWADPRTGSTNNEKSYKKLCTLITNGRLAGLIDWDAIVDRGRFVRKNEHWNGPGDIVRTCVNWFRLDRWDRQPYYCEVAVEKDALVGVLETVCRGNDVPYMACRGYASVSEVWRMATQRFLPKLNDGKRCVLFYLGDHDPSGIDMSRDLQERLDLFTERPAPGRLGRERHVEVRRLALNMDQITLYNPPPNPTKSTDTRSATYRAEYGDDCWELDALDPVVIRDLIQNAVESVRDPDLWDAAVGEEHDNRRDLAAVARNWQDAVAAVGGGGDADV